MEAERARHEVGQLCRCLGMARSAFYAWKSRPPSARTIENIRIRREMRLIHAESDRTYGSPRMWLELRQRGYPRISVSRVIRLMRAEKLSARPVRRRPRYRVQHGAMPAAPNLVAQQFDVGTVNRVWVSDITYLWTSHGWLYLAAVLDLGSRRVVGWVTRASLSRDLVLEAFRRALESRLPNAGLIHHSDRGSQFNSNEFQVTLARHGIRCSMSAKGNCYDNAVVEAFFATLKRERVWKRRYATREEAERDLFEYIEVFYNRKRRHTSLGGLSPVDFERQLGIEHA
ncbi:MAG TPA: IS3 family transposase [Candidatus Krumholzibacteria bacterium]|nr:IS3 family transposase [Candidatus Krumholzibacteria bacterium]